MVTDLTISGIQSAQDANNRKIAALKGPGLSRILRVMAAEAHRYAVSITHVDTGTLRSSHRMEIEEGAGRASIFLDPSATNPRSGARASVYGQEEHARGADHAFYARTVRERGRAIAEMGARALVQEMKR